MPGKSPRRAKTMRALVARGAGMPCRVEGCGRPREGATLCETHRQRRRKYGNPEGHRIFRKDYEVERRMVRALFKDFPDHPGVIEACRWLQDWMDASIAGDTQQPGYIHVARLHRWEVKPLTILTEVCALWTFAQWNQRTLPDDERLTFALAIALIFLAPLDQTRAKSRATHGGRYDYRAAGRAVRKEIGEHLRLTLARLFVNVTSTLEAQQQQQRARRNSLGAPFITTKEATP